MALNAETAFRKDRRTGKTKMEHRHFATVAAIIADDLATVATDNERRAIAEVFANGLAGTNPRFDRRRFLKACGVLD